MAIAITVTDQQNGGDVVVAVSGNVATTAQVYRQGLTADAWTAFGAPITGNGNVAASVPATGYYWWRAELTTGPQSNFVRQVVRGASTSLWHQIGEAMRATIQDAVTAGAFARITDPARVALIYEYNPSVLPIDCPGIAVILNGKKLPVGGNNMEEDKAYPVIVLALDRNSAHRQVKAADPYHDWHEQLENLFLHGKQNLADVVKHGISIVTDIEITYPDAVEFLRNRYEEVRVGLQVNVKTREERGP